MKFLLAFLLFASFCEAQSNSEEKQNVDLILYNGNIISGPFSEQYHAMVLNNGKIIKLYKNNGWKKNYRSNQIIDLQKQFVFPGFIDGHCHFLGLGKAMDEVNLFGCKSWEETLERVKQFSESHPDMNWIQGRGWDQNNWEHKSFPNNNLLDSLFPNKFIVLTRVDGHAIIANSKVLNFSNISANTLVDGGKLMTECEKLTGVLIDNATSLVENNIPKATKQQKIKWLIEAEKECKKYGLTQVADAGLPISDILLIDSLCQQNVLTMRFYLMANPERSTWEYLKNSGTITHKNVIWQSIKIYSDGALGSRGALLKKPYCDDKLNYGLQLIDTVKLDSILKICYDNNLQACTHCIGDSANALVLKSYSKFLKTTTNDRRWRIEHAQVVDSSDLNFFRTYSIIPSVQPTHATSDMGWAQNRLCSNRMIGAYSYKSLLENSSFITLGTDFPVEFVSPFNTIIAARFRQNSDGMPKDGFNKKESLTSTQTFAGMSLWAAMGNFWEDSTGTLEEGKYADFIILEKNPYTASLLELKTLEILKTYIDGKLVYIRSNTK